MRRSVLFILAFTLAMPLMARLGFAGDSQPTEYQLKAAYIYHFAQFVDWPATAFNQTNSPLIIGVLGKNPFGSDLEHTVQGKILGGHPLVVQEFTAISDITNACHILFISDSEKKQLTQIIAALDDTSTLTVGESDRFIESGGMIKFVPDGIRIRFEINRTRAVKSGLRISFKLLNLASELH
jgi:hypothetical protein